MDDFFSIIFFIWFAFVILEGLVKKRQVPPTIDSDLDRQQQNSESATFEIPTLANDPNLQRDPIPTEEVLQSAEIKTTEQIFRQRQELFRQSLLNQTKNKTIEPQKPLAQRQSKFDSNINLNLNFTEADALNAMILSEIFNKPKSLRRR